MRISIYDQNNTGVGSMNSGGQTFTGPVYLAGDPTTALQAAPKQYVDSTLAVHASNTTVHYTPSEKTFISGITVSATVINQMAGASSPIQTQLDNKVNLTGSTMHGFLFVPMDPVTGLNIVSKAYVDFTINSINKIPTGDIITKPTSVTPTGFLKCNGAYVAITSYPDLFATIGHSFDGAGLGSLIDIPYTSHSCLGSGNYWKQQYDLSPNAGVLNSFSTSSLTLPAALAWAQAITTKNRVYVIGGIGGPAATNTIYTAPINSDGTLGAFTLAGTIPNNIYSAAAFITKNRIYLVGGSDGSNKLYGVYTAPINTDGTLGAWTLAYTMGVSPELSQVVVTKNRVYLLANWTGAAYTTAIYTATINSDGTINAFTTDTNVLPTAFSYSSVVVTQNRVYLLGGGNGSPLNTIYTAIINADGTLGAFTLDANTLPVLINGAQAVVLRDKVYLIGGGNSSAVLNTVYVANINADGTLGVFTNAGITLPVGLVGSQAIITKNHVYLLGGGLGSSYTNAIYVATISNTGFNDYTKLYDGTINTFDGVTDLSGNYNLSIYISSISITLSYTDYAALGSGKPWKQQYDLSPNAGSITSAAASGLTLPTAVAAAQAIITKNRVYLLGGHSDSASVFYNTIQTALINTDGTLGAFTIDSNKLPVGLAWSQAIVTKNRVYLLGGISGTGLLNTIYTALINADGTLSTFVNSGAILPITLEGSQAVVTKNRVYLLGGTDGTNTLNTVYTAPINADGTLGVFTLDTNTLPTGVAYSKVIVTQNRVYLLGGRLTGTTSTNIIQTASINVDGTLAQFTTDANTLPIPLDTTETIIFKDKVYLIGGYSSGTTISSIYKALINIDGTLNIFNLDSITLPSAYGWEEAVITQNHIYLLGGYNGTTNVAQNYVNIIPITNAGLNDYQEMFNGDINKFDGTDLSGTITILSGTPDPSIYFGLPDNTYVDSKFANVFSYIKT